MATQRTSTRITKTLRITKDELESIVKAHYGLHSSTVEWDIGIIGTVEAMVIETTSTVYDDADVVL